MPWANARGRLSLAALGLSLLVASQLARTGVARLRAASVAIVALTFLGTTAWRWARQKRTKTAESKLAHVAALVGESDVDRALQAHALYARLITTSASEGVSPSLAKVHALRSIGRLDLARLSRGGDRHATRLTRAAWIVGAVAIAGVLVAPSRCFEGLDVAVARHGVAPVELTYLDEIEVTIHPPSYLHLDDRHVDGRTPLMVPHGSALVVRGVPRRSGRALFLSDEGREVPFLDDGSGGVVAHWSADRSGALRVRARFGDVAIVEPKAWALDVVEDEVPIVRLEGAPKVIEIAKAGASITLPYDAVDDHGLREIHMVLRVAGHEERRVVAKLDGEPRHDTGGPVLRIRDPIVKGAKTPLRVRIEARDNDAVTGPKWGRSEEITLVPPKIGAAEAERYAALVAERDALIDFLATVMGDAKPLDATGLRKAFDAARDTLLARVNEQYGGEKVPRRLAIMLRGRLRKVREAVEAEEKEKTASKDLRAKTVKSIEHLALGLDDGLRALDHRDARAIAKELAVVADDAADGLRALRAQKGDSANANADERVTVDVDALSGGGGSLRGLGELGLDLGEIVEADLRRVSRAATANPADLVHAERAMRDLAARLHNPVPSLGGGMGGGGSGSGKGSGDDDKGKGDDGESDGEEGAGNAEDELEELAKDHGAAVGEVDDVLRSAEDPKSVEGLAEEAKKRAKALREIVAGMPKIASTRRGTPEGAESSLREKSEAMAEALERLELGDAKERGETALKAADEARDLSWSQPAHGDKIDDVAREVQREVDWLDDILKKVRKEASAKTKPQLEGKAPRERGLEQRAKDLAAEPSDEGEPSAKGKGKKKHREALPSEAKDLVDEAREKMDEAAKALEQGDADKATRAQREAQKLLDRAQKSIEGETPQSGDDDGDRTDPDAVVGIPKADDHKGPDAFRKRVLDGLSGAGGSAKLREAARRYAEGLIQ